MALGLAIQQQKNKKFLNILDLQQTICYTHHRIALVFPPLANFRWASTATRADLPRAIPCQIVEPMLSRRQHTPFLHVVQAFDEVFLKKIKLQEKENII